MSNLPVPFHLLNIMVILNPHNGPLVLVFDKSGRFSINCNLVPWPSIDLHFWPQEHKYSYENFSDLGKFYDSFYESYKNQFEKIGKY